MTRSSQIDYDALAERLTDPAASAPTGSAPRDATSSLLTWPPSS